MSTANPKWMHATRPTDLIPAGPDDGNGARMVKLCEQFVMTQGPMAGQRFGAAMLPWQRALVRRAFGDPSVQTVGLKCGKGSGKTTLVAAIAVASVMDWSARGINTRAQIVIVSATVEAARITFEHIVEAVRADPHLAPKFKSNLSRKEVTHIATGVAIRVISPMLKAAVGLRPGLLIADELHAAAIGSREFAQVVDQLRRGGMNAESFKYLGLTTAAASRPEGYFLDWLTKLRAVRDGELHDPSVLPVLFEFPPQELRPDLDVTDPGEWWRGMPSLRTPDNPLGTMDASALEEELREAADSADLLGPGAMELLLSQRLGLEAIDRGGGTRATPLARHWDDCLDPTLSVPEGRPLVVGFDPSAGLDDPAAAVTVVLDGERYLVWSRQWLTREAFEAAPRQLRATYDRAINAGELTIVDSTGELEAALMTHARKLQASTQATFGGDARGLAGFSRRFEQQVGRYEPISQGWELRAALEFASGLAADRRLRHAGQPLLTANVRNLVVEGTRLRKFDSDSSGMGSAKIDGCMALLSAIQLAEAAPVFDVAAMIG